MNSTEQEIHAIVSPLSSNCIWLFSLIYASPRITERCCLWDNLEILAGLHNLPWLIMGDFNEVVSGREKFGDNRVNVCRATKFNNFMDSCNMIDLGFVGLRFTWTNKRGLDGLILERLDRA